MYKIYLHCTEEQGLSGVYFHFFFFVYLCGFFFQPAFKVHHCHLLSWSVDVLRH